MSLTKQISLATLQYRNQYDGWMLATTVKGVDGVQTTWPYLLSQLKMIPAVKKSFTMCPSLVAKSGSSDSYTSSLQSFFGDAGYNVKSFKKESIIKSPSKLATLTLDAGRYYPARGFLQGAYIYSGILIFSNTFILVFLKNQPIRRGAVRGKNLNIKFIR